MAVFLSWEEGSLILNKILGLQKPSIPDCRQEKSESEIGVFIRQTIWHDIANRPICRICKSIDGTVRHVINQLVFRA